MLKEVEDVECEVNKQLDTAIKNDNVSYKNSCLPPENCRLNSNGNFLLSFAHFEHLNHQTSDKSLQKHPITMY